MFVVTVASTSRSIAPALRSAKSARAVRLPLPPLLAPIQQRAFSASIRPLADATSKLALPPSIKDAEAYSRWYGKLSKDDQQAHMRWRRDFQKQQAEQELPVILPVQKTLIPLTWAQRAYGYLLYYRNPDVKDFMYERWAQFSRVHQGVDALAYMYMPAVATEPADFTRCTTRSWRGFVPHLFRSIHSIYGEVVVGKHGVRRLYEDYNIAIAEGNEAAVRKMSVGPALRDALDLIQRSKGRRMFWDREVLPERPRFGLGSIFGSLLGRVNPEIFPIPPNVQVLWLGVTKLQNDEKQIALQICVRFDWVQLLEVIDTTKSKQKPKQSRRRVIENVVFERAIPETEPSSGKPEEAWFVKAKTQHNPAQPDFIRNMSVGDFLRRLWQGKKYVSPAQIAAPSKAKTS